MEGEGKDARPELREVKPPFVGGAYLRVPGWVMAGYHSLLGLCLALCVLSILSVSLSFSMPLRFRILIPEKC